VSRGEDGGGGGEGGGGKGSGGEGGCGIGGGYEGGGGVGGGGGDGGNTTGGRGSKGHVVKCADVVLHEVKQGPKGLVAVPVGPLGKVLSHFGAALPAGPLVLYARGSRPCEFNLKEKLAGQHALNHEAARVLGLGHLIGSAHVFFEGVDPHKPGQRTTPASNCEGLGGATRCRFRLRRGLPRQQGRGGACGLRE
jgi:hypothetical protein